MSLNTNVQSSPLLLVHNRSGDEELRQKEKRKTFKESRDEDQNEEEDVWSFAWFLCLQMLKRNYSKVLCNVFLSAKCQKCFFLHIYYIFM